MAAGMVGMGPVDTLVGRMVLQQKVLEAVASGNEAELEKFLAIHEAWRRTGTEMSRAMRLRRDFQKSPAERNRGAVMDAILTPSDQDQRNLDRASVRVDRAATVEQKQKALDALHQLRLDVAKKLTELPTKIKNLTGHDINTMAARDWADVQISIRIIRAVQTIKAPAWKWVHEWWINSILSAPITHLRNISGNTIFQAWDFTAQRMTEAMVNNLISAVPGTAPVAQSGAASFSEMEHMLKGLLPGMSKAWLNFFATFDREQTQFADELSQSKIERTERAPAIPGRFGRIVRIPTRLLLAEDDAAKTLIANIQVWAEAYRIAKSEGQSGNALSDRMNQLIQDQFSQAWVNAREQADRLTFTDDPGSLAKALLKARREVPALRFIIPFVTTPFNIFRVGLKKSPLGSLRLLWKSARTGMVQIKADRGGNFEYTRQEFVVDTAEQILAWGVTLALLGLILPDEEGLPRITGTAPKGWGERELAYRTAPPMSIRISDGTWLSYNGIEPFAVALATLIDGLNLFHRAKNAEEGGRVLSKGLESFMSQVESKTFLRGLGDLMEVLRRPATTGPKWGVNFATSWVPNIVRASVREADPDIRQTRVFPRETMSAFWSQAALRVKQGALPVEAIAPPPRVDLWGRDIKKFQGSGPRTDWIYRMLVPLRRYRVDLGLASDLDRMILNWNNSNPSDIRAPQTPQAAFSHRGVRIFMTDEEYHTYLQAVGKRAFAMAEGQIWHFQDPTERDMGRLDSVLRRARRIEKLRFVAALRRDSDPRLKK